MTAGGPILETTRVGAWRVHAIFGGLQRLDGGAMFGVVPKPLWERRIAPDARNRIPLAMRSLLVEHDAGLVLIETGAGNKESERFRDVYGIENEGTAGPTALEDGIRSAGFRPEDVSYVINTHLHFDHAGGNTYRGDDGGVHLAFPRARYVVQRGEYAFATSTNERTAASYLAHNFVPVMEAGRFDLVEGRVELLPGLELLPTPGHVPFHQAVLMRSKGEAALYAADLVPTAAHLALPWIMGYDVEPLITLETKRRVLRQALDEGWLVVFDHDPVTAWSRIAHDGKAYVLAAAAGDG